MKVTDFQVANNLYRGNRSLILCINSHIKRIQAYVKIIWRLMISYLTLFSPTVDKETSSKEATVDQSPLKARPNTAEQCQQ